MAGRLILVRHAKSDYPWGVDDHDRPVNERGRRDAPAAGAWLGGHATWEPGCTPIVVVSTARRAQLTWGLMRTSLPAEWEDVEVVDEPRIYEAEASDIIAAAAEAAQGRDTVIVVGHNPGLAQVVRHTARLSPLRDEALAKFPTSAIAVLESGEPLAEALTVPQSFDVVAFAVPRG